MADEEEEARRRGIERLEQLVGSEEIRALMGQIPPFRWEEIATKQDLAVLRGELSGRLDQVERRLEGGE